MAKSVNDFSTSNNRGRFHELEIESYDAFGKKISDSVRTEVDIASHYNFNPERLRLFRNGTRQFVMYGDTTDFNDAVDVWQLQPSAGNKLHIESAATAVYSVGYELLMTCSFSVNKELSAGDKLRFGPYNGTDGWVFEQRGGDHQSNEGDLIVSKGGTETTLESDVVLPKPITDFCRYFVQYNWYNAGHQKWGQTFTDSGEQYNELFAKTSVDGDRATNTGNVNLRYELEASTTTSGLEMDCGSISVVTLGNTTNMNRLKQQEELITLPAGNDNIWVPLLALRTDPSNPNVSSELNKLEVHQYSSNSDLEMLALSVSSDKTDASGWDTPEFHHSYNSAIQTTGTITEVPDVNGTQKVLTASDDPGGYTLGTSTLLDGGGGSESARISSALEISRKRILNSDEVVLLARASASGGDVDFSWQAKQIW